MAERRSPHIPFVLAIAGQWGWRIVAGAAALVVMGYVLAKLSVVIVPLVLALFLAAVLEPLAARLRRRGVPPALAAVAVFIGGLVGIGLVLTWIVGSVILEFEDVGERVGQAVEDIKTGLQRSPLNLSEERLERLQQQLSGSIGQDGGGAGVARGVVTGVRTVTEFLGGFVLMLFALFFLLKDGHRMADWLKERLPADYREDFVALTTRSQYVMRQYLLATAATGFIDGVLIGIALAVVGVPLVLPLAVLTFLGGFFPIVGATIAGLIAALVALVDGGVTAALLIVAATIGVQQIEGNLLQPLILERAVRLHALVTVVAVAAGLLLFGLLGAFLSVPVVAILVGMGSFYRERTLAAPGTAPAPATPIHE